MATVKELCRLCLEPNLQANSSYQIGDEEVLYKLTIVFNFELPEEESLPCEVCSDCFSKTTEWFCFHETVRSNQSQLRAMIVDGGVSSSSEAFLIIKEEPSVKDERGYSESEGDLEEDQQDQGVEIAMELEVKEESDSDGSSEDDVPLLELKSTVTKTRKRTKKKAVEKAEDEDEKAKRLEEENQKIKEFFKISCEFCSDSFETFDRLQRHCRKAHNARARIKCCDRSLWKKCRIIEHIDSHVNPNQFHCDLCNKSYNSRYYLDLHNLKKHNDEAEKPFKCEKCGHGFPKEFLLKAHLLTHVQAECPICHKVLANGFTLKCHIANIHSGAPKLICETCGQEFRTKLGMERHTKQHQGLTPIERVKCPICSKWVNGKPNLKMHISTVHVANEAVPCDVCQQMYPNVRAMANHKRRVHVEEKFECEFCGKKFKRSIYLKEHRASHTGQSLYTCDVCGVGMNSNANLYSHKKSKHPEEWLERKKKARAIAYGTYETA